MFDFPNANVHVHVNIPAEELQRLQRIEDGNIALRIQLSELRELLLAKATTINQLLDQINENTNAEAVENQRQTEALTAIETSMQVLRDQIAAGTKGLTEEEADLAIARLDGLTAATAAIRAREEEQSARMTALGNPAVPEPVPAPIPEPEPIPVPEPEAPTA